MISPMCMYAAADGLANAYHLVHLGRFALGGAGIVVAEATAITPQGRISNQDLGLWNDAQANALRPTAMFLREHGAIAGIQLGHAGRKAATSAPWHGGGPLGEADAARDDDAWPVAGPSAIAAGPGWQEPAELTGAEIGGTIAAWSAAAARAVGAGFQLIELHGAHGYLLHSFQSAIANRRTDAYGGSAENRMRYPIEVVRAVRRAIGESCVLSYRISAVDGIEGGVTLEDSVAFCAALYAAGVDIVDTSSGGVIADRSADTRIRRGFAFHTPYSREVRRRTGGLVATVGLIVDPHQAESVLRAGDADIVAIGREALHEPNWPHRARAALCGENFDEWHKEAGWWLDKRAMALRQLADQGETPLTRYAEPSGEMQ